MAKKKKRRKVTLEIDVPQLTHEAREAASRIASCKVGYETEGGTQWIDPSEFTREMAEAEVDRLMAITDPEQLRSELRDLIVGLVEARSSSVQLATSLLRLDQVLGRIRSALDRSGNA